eukprot:3714873-Prymnesium_polylepis.2
MRAHTARQISLPPHRHFSDSVPPDATRDCTFARLLRELAERSACRVEQRERRIILLNGAGVQQQHAVVKGDRVQPVGDGEDGAVAAEIALDHLLDATVSGVVHARRRLVHHEERPAAQQRARHAQQLPLAGGEVGAALGHVRVEARWHRRHLGGEARTAERLVQLVVAVLADGCEVVPHCECTD